MFIEIGLSHWFDPNRVGCSIACSQNQAVFWNALLDILPIRAAAFTTYIALSGRYSEVYILIPRRCPWVIYIKGFQPIAILTSNLKLQNW